MATVKDFGEEQKRALELYKIFREKNPYLPPPEKVTADGFTVDSGPNQLTTMDINVYVEMPDWDLLREVESSL